MKECPTCHRTFEVAARVCESCRRPIKRNHRWHIHGWVVRHDDCRNPQLLPEVQPQLTDFLEQMQDVTDV